MKAFVTAACLLAGCAGAPTAGPGTAASKAGPRTVVLPNADFELAIRTGEGCPARWGCRAHADPTSYRFFVEGGEGAGGKQYACIERRRNEPWGVLSQGIIDPALGGHRLRLGASVRGQELQGEGGGLFMLVQGPGNALFHDERLVKSTEGWVRMQAEFDVPKGAEMVEVGVTLQGPGRFCVDDLRLEVVGPAAASAK